MLGLNRICEDIGGFKFGGLVQEDVDRLMFQFDSQFNLIPYMPSFLPIIIIIEVVCEQS